jgi:ATP-dependent protease ClpP protease subunit
LNFNDGNVFFLTDFDDTMESSIVLPLIREIQKQREYKHGRIDLYINSFGGYRHLAYQLVDLIEIAKREEVTVRTIVPNVAFSAGSFLAIAGTPGERYISRHGMHLIHYGTAGGSNEETIRQVERTAKVKKELMKDVVRHYSTYSDVPDLEDNISDDGFVVPAKKCIKYGLADAYTDTLDIGYAE